MFMYRPMIETAQLGGLTSYEYHVFKLQPAFSPLLPSGKAIPTRLPVKGPEDRSIQFVKVIVEENAIF